MNIEMRFIRGDQSATEIAVDGVDITHGIMRRGFKIETTEFGPNVHMILMPDRLSVKGDANLLTSLHERAQADAEPLDLSTRTIWVDRNERIELKAYGEGEPILTATVTEDGRRLDLDPGTRVRSGVDNLRDYDHPDSNMPDPFAEPAPPEASTYPPGYPTPPPIPAP